MDKIYQIFISSTFEDLKMERQDVMAAVVSTGNVPVGMEYFPAGDAAPFDYIKKQIDSVDYYILIVAGKYGSINKETGLSYTEMEFDYAVEKKVPIAVLQYKDLNTLTGDKLEIEDPKKRELLESFRKRSKEGRMADFWESRIELQMKVKDAIRNLIKNSPRTGWVRADQVLTIQQSEEEKQLDENHIREAERHIAYAHNVKQLGEYVRSNNELLLALLNLVQCKDKARAKSSLDEAMRNMHKTLEQRDKIGKCRITEGSRVHILELFKFFDHELKEDTIRLINKAQEVSKDFSELSEDVFKSRKGN